MAKPLPDRANSQDTGLRKRDELLAQTDWASSKMYRELIFGGETTAGEGGDGQNYNFKDHDSSVTRLNGPNG